MKSPLIVITENTKSPAPINFIFSQASERTATASRGNAPNSVIHVPLASASKPIEVIRGDAHGEIANKKEVLMNSWHKEYIL